MTFSGILIQSSEIGEHWTRAWLRAFICNGFSGDVLASRIADAMTKHSQASTM